MLEKQPAHRPGAIEVQQHARAIASRDWFPARSSAAGGPARTIDTVDADSLEYGITELVPTMRGLRWTPEIAVVPAAAIAHEILPRKRRP